MRIFFLDLASHSGLLACVTESAVIAAAPGDHRIGDHELVPMMEQTLQDAGWTFADLTYIACVAGPGGFTSLRVAVSAANALADQLQIPVTGIGLWELYAARCDDEDAVWIHSTKRSEVFIRGVSDRCTAWSGSLPTHATLENAVAATPASSRYCGELLPEHQQAFEAAGVQPAPVRPLQDVLPSFLAERTYARDLLRPWYGRGW